MWTLAVISVGIVIGWQLPQPQWAQKVQWAVTTWIKDKIESWSKK